MSDNAATNQCNTLATFEGDHPDQHWLWEDARPEPRPTPHHLSDLTPGLSERLPDPPDDLAQQGCLYERRAA